MTNLKVKDKKLLQNARSKIEIETEKFKSWEKVVKAKAFSKEGLAATIKQDEEKEKTRKWLDSYLKDLEDVKNSHETEVEKIKKNKKSERKSGKNRMLLLVQKIEDLNFHCQKIEYFLRALENDRISSFRLNEIKEMLEYFLENSNYKEALESEYEGLETKILQRIILNSMANQGRLNSRRRGRREG
jgi:CCR4-NOT transcriptional regulation complex NOT5 subunit